MSINSPNIQPSQLIYTRVETAYSPKGAGGFQTYYASPSMSGQTIRFIEDRVNNFDTRDPNIHRIQFFRLENGDAVITHTQAVDTDIKILDSAGRSGIFIAHCLIFPKADFQKIYNDPFWVLDQSVKFVDNAQTMIQEYDFSVAKEQPILIPIPSSQTGLPSGFGEWTENLCELAQLGEYLHLLMAKPVTENDKILLYGTQDTILDCLRTLFFLTPPPKRLACSFDTHIPKSNFPAESFSIIGSPDRKGSAGVVVNTETHQVNFSRSTPVNTNLYLRWLQNKPNLDVNAGLKVVTFQEWGFAFSNHSAPNMSRLLNESSLEFFSQNIEVVKTNLLIALRKVFSAEFAQIFTQFLVNFVLQQEKYVNDIMTFAATGALDAKICSEIARRWLVDLSPDILAKLKNNILTDLLKLATSANDNVLEFWTLELKGDHKQAKIVLEKMIDDEYSASLELAKLHTLPARNQVVPLVNFMNSQHANIFLNQLEKHLMDLSDEDFYEVIEALLDQQQCHLLESFSPRVVKLTNKYLTKLESKLKRVRPIPTEFLTAIQVRRRDLGRPYSLIDNLLR